MSASDVWEVTFQGELLGQDCDNVFFYRGVDISTPDEAAIADAMYEQIWPLVQDVVSLDYTLNSIDVRHLFSGASPFSLPVGEAGTRGGGQSLGSFEALSMVLGVETNATRPGSKRFGGMDETFISDGLIVDGALISSINTLADGLADALVDTSAGIIVWALPVVVKRILEDGVYRLPTSLGELVTNLIVSAFAHLIVSSQNSRKQPFGS